MKISLIAVGRLKTPYWAAAQKEYLQRIRRYSPLTLVEVKDRAGEEADDILHAADDYSAIISLTPAGKPLPSLEWARELMHLLETYSKLAFVIGGPLGLSERVLKKSALTLSLSAMTFPHEMARVVFLEQLYRAFTILKGEKYHK